MIGELFHVFIEFVLVLLDCLLKGGFLLQKMLVLGFDLVDLLFPLSDSVFIGFLEEGDSILKLLVFIHQLFVFLFLRLNGLDLLLELVVFDLKLNKLRLINIC